MRLAAEGNFGGEQKNLSGAQGRLSDGDAAFEILLAPRPAAVKWRSGCEPGDRGGAFHGCVRVEAKHRASIEEHIYFIRQTIGERVGVVDGRGEKRPARLWFAG